LNEPFVLSSLEEIEEMERQCLQSIEALEISDDSVKCQRCGIAVPIVGKLNRPCHFACIAAELPTLLTGMNLSHNV